MDDKRESELRDGWRSMIAETIAKRQNTVIFSQGTYDAIVKTIPDILAGMFRALAVAHHEQADRIDRLERELSELKTLDARRIERIREAAEEGKRRALVAQSVESTEIPAEQGGAT